MSIGGRHRGDGAERSQIARRRHRGRVVVGRPDRAQPDRVLFVRGLKLPARTTHDHARVPQLDASTMRHDPGGVLPGHVVRRREVKTIGEFKGGLGRARLANCQRGGRRLGIRRDVGGGRDLQFQAFPIEQPFDGERNACAWWHAKHQAASAAHARDHIAGRQWSDGCGRRVRGGRHRSPAWLSAPCRPTRRTPARRLFAGGNGRPATHRRPRAATAPVSADCWCRGRD